MDIRIPALAWAAAACAAAGPSQTPGRLAPGYAASELVRDRGHAFGFGGFAPGAEPGSLFFGVEHTLLHRDPAGLVTEVHAFAVGARVDLVHRRPGSATLCYADDRSGRLRVRDLRSGAEAVRPLPANCFDLCETARGDLLAAANPAWPAPAARPGIWLLDPSGGTAHRELARFAGGASGPLAPGPAGDLYCATVSAVYPAPPASVRILRFRAARLAAVLAGGPALTEADAELFADRLDGAFDLTFDDRGMLLVSDPQHGTVRAIGPDGVADPQPLFAADPGFAVLGLAFVDGGPPTFAPFQPGDGAGLLVGTNDWSRHAAVDRIAPARPRATSPAGDRVGPGNLAIEVAGLPAAAAGLVAFNILPPLPREVALLSVGGAPVWWQLDPQMPFLAVAVAADAQGRARVDLAYAGGLSWTLAIQAAALAPPGQRPLLATSPALSVTLLP